VASGGPLPLEIEVRARALAPGELVRIDVVSAVPLSQAEAEFLGTTVFLIRGDAPEGARRWSGWSMIGLDQRPGPAGVEVRGTTVGGRAALGTRAVTIEARLFPEEDLSVPPSYVEPPEQVRLRIARERRRLAEIYATRRTTFPAEPFARPVAGKPTSVFGTRRLFNGEPRSPHPGLDLRASDGTPVTASGPGVVVLAHDLYYAGNTVIVDHGGGLFTLYAHLSAFATSEGDIVRRGQTLGLSGATGRVTGPHLHWGAKIGDRPFDPTALLESSLFGRP
jgi:murein DD-endopeptidase MepM/ murein hydrolase activator NlpD